MNSATNIRTPCTRDIHLGVYEQKLSNTFTYIRLVTIIPPFSFTILSIFALEQSLSMIYLA